MLERVTKGMIDRELGILNSHSTNRFVINGNIQGRQVCYCCNLEDTKDGTGYLTFYGTKREIWEQLHAINRYREVEKLAQQKQERKPTEKEALESAQRLKAWANRKKTKCADCGKIMDDFRLWHHDSGEIEMVCSDCAEEQGVKE